MLYIEFSNRVLHLPWYCRIRWCQMKQFAAGSLGTWGWFLTSNSRDQCITVIEAFTFPDGRANTIQSHFSFQSWSSVWGSPEIMLKRCLLPKQPSAVHMQECVLCIMLLTICGKSHFKMFFTNKICCLQHMTLSRNSMSSNFQAVFPLQSSKKRHLVPWLVPQATLWYKTLLTHLVFIQWTYSNHSAWKCGRQQWNATTTQRQTADAQHITQYWWTVNLEAESLVAPRAPWWLKRGTSSFSTWQLNRRGGASFHLPIYHREPGRRL